MTFRLELKDVSVAYERDTVVRGASIGLEEGHIGCLLGPSGCGKTTLLRAIAGFEPVSTGEIRLHGRTVSRPGHTLAAESRRVGMVFQDFALFPHLTVADNIRFGIREQDRFHQDRRIQELLALIDLKDLGSDYPHRLSGGQQQRVAIARALAPNPEILLLDEPFSSMDADLREQLASEIREVLKQERMTAVLVTHDQNEAFAMADDVGVMNAGIIEQWDTGYRLYHAPTTRFVADFIGLGVMLPGRIRADGDVETELGPLPSPPGSRFQPGTAVEFLVRPDDIMCSEEGPLTAQVMKKQFRGAEFLYHLRLPSGRRILCLVPSHHDHPIGEQIGLAPDLEHVVMFERPNT